MVAKAAAINPMTVSKAYSRLETEGLVERVRGRGMRLLDASKVLPLAQRQAQLRTLLEPILLRAQQLGLDEQEIRKTIDDLLKELP